MPTIKRASQFLFSFFIISKYIYDYDKDGQYEKNISYYCCI